MRELKARKCKRVHDIHFSPDGRRLLAVGGSEVLLVESAVWLDLATGENVGRIDQIGSTHAVSPDASLYILTGANADEEWGGVAPVQSIDPLGDSPAWAPFPAEELIKPADHTSFQNITALTFDRTGKWVAAITQWESRSKGLIVFRRGTAEIVRRILLVFSTGWENLGVLDFNSDASRVAVTGGYDGNPEVVVYDSARGKKVYQFRPSATTTRSLQFLPDNQLVAANGRKLLVFPPDGPEPARELAGHKGQVNALAVTPDGQRILSASHDGGIRLWDVNRDQPAATYDWNIGPITAVKFSPDGLTCAAAGLNGRVIIWDVDA